MHVLGRSTNKPRAGPYTIVSKFKSGRYIVDMHHTLFEKLFVILPLNEVPAEVSVIVL